MVKWMFVNLRVHNSVYVCPTTQSTYVFWSLCLPLLFPCPPSLSRIHPYFSQFRPPCFNPLSPSPSQFVLLFVFWGSWLDSPLPPPPECCDYRLALPWLVWSSSSVLRKPLLPFFICSFPLGRWPSVLKRLYSFILGETKKCSDFWYIFYGLT